MRERKLLLALLACLAAIRATRSRSASSRSLKNASVMSLRVSRTYFFEASRYE